MVTSLYVFNLITFYDSSNFVFFFSILATKKKIGFYKLSFHFFYFNSISRIPTHIHRIPTPIPRILTQITRIPFQLHFIPFPFPTFPAFPGIPLRFTSFPPQFLPFPAFPSFRFPIPYSGFYR